MSTPENILSNYREHQLDGKMRVAIPAEWRPAEGISLRLMSTETHGFPVVRAFTEQAYERKLAEIEAHPRFVDQPGKRDTARRFFKSHCHPVEVNSQGKLTIPRSLAEAAQLPLPGKVRLEYTEGEYIELFTIENHEAMLEKQSNDMSEFKDLFSIG